MGLAFFLSTVSKILGSKNPFPCQHYCLILERTLYLWSETMVIMKKYFHWIILAAIAILFLALRLPQILRNEFPFVFDFGRDLIWVRNMVELRRPTLIGPWGSLAGVYFGPLWYYLLSIPYVIFKGDPRGPVYLTLAANLAVALLGFLWLKKFDLKLGLIFAFLIAISPHSINLSTFAF